MKNLRIKYRSVKELEPYERNSRTHSEEQVAQIISSIREFGWTNPILIDEDDGADHTFDDVREARTHG